MISLMGLAFLLFLPFLIYRVVTNKRIEAQLDKEQEEDTNKAVLSFTTTFANAKERIWQAEQIEQAKQLEQSEQRAAEEALLVEAIALWEHKERSKRYKTRASHSRRRKRRRH